MGRAGYGENGGPDGSEIATVPANPGMRDPQPERDKDCLAVDTEDSKSRPDARRVREKTLP